MVAFLQSLQVLFMNMTTLWFSMLLLLLLQFRFFSLYIYVYIILDQARGAR